jgi:hypothetical protein
MNSLQAITEMRGTLTSMASSMTAYSSKREHQNYLESLKHYKKILTVHLSRLSDEIDVAIEKTNKNINSFSQPDNNLISRQVLNGSQ